MSKRFLAAAGLALCLTAGPAAAADTPVNLRISLWVPPAHPLVPATKAWADDITKESGGTITASIFPSEQLGKAFDHYDMARDGIADITYVNPGYQPGRFPVIALGQIPFTFADGHSGSKALDAWYRKYAAKEMPDTKVCLAFIHAPGTLHSKRKVVVPSDLKGMKVRPAQSTIGQLISMEGGTNVQASAPETRDMLDRGVADALFFPWGSVVLFGIDKVVKYHIDAPLYTTVFTYNMNLDKYNAMSPAQKKVIDDHCTMDWAEKLSSSWTDFEAGGRDKIAAEPGHEVYKLTPEQLDQWKAAAGPLHKQWEDSVRKVGIDPAKADADMQAALKQYGAAY